MVSGLVPAGVWVAASCSNGVPRIFPSEGKEQSGECPAVGSGAATPVGWRKDS